MPGVWAGGDCVAGGEDLTVAAVEDGKQAALSIDRALDPPPRRAQLEGGTTMADLRVDFVGIKSPNPFWLASAPPTDKEYNVVRAFKAGWGGVVWKTLGEEPAGRQRQRPALRRHRTARTAALHRLQQYRADHRPAAAR